MDAVDGVADDVVDDDVDVGYAGDAVVSVDDGSCDATIFKQFFYVFSFK